MPKSFLNRIAKVVYVSLDFNIGGFFELMNFISIYPQVYVDQLEMGDLLYIASAMYPQIDEPIVARMVAFNTKLHEATMVERRYIFAVY